MSFNSEELRRAAYLHPRHGKELDFVETDGDEMPGHQNPTEGNIHDELLCYQDISR